MFRTETQTTYRGPWSKSAQSGLDQPRLSGSGGSSHQLDAGLPPASPGSANGSFMEKTYSGPFKGAKPQSLHRVSQEYSGPYGSGTNLNQLDQQAGVHEHGTPQLNAIGTNSGSGTPSGQYHGALSRSPSGQL